MRLRSLFALLVTLTLVACSGSDGTDGSDGENGQTLLVESSTADSCAAGGTSLVFGYDTTGDGAIDQELATETVCAGEDGEDGTDGMEGPAGEDGNSVLTETDAADPADCPAGGTTVTFGYDTTGDGAIDDVLETANVCDGADGSDGNSVLVETATADPADCPAGGTTVTFGYDTTGDDAIDDVVETTNVCDGADGQTILTETGAAASGACAAGGTTVTFGYDTTGDGAIDQTVDTATVCNGEDGANGADGADGDSVLVESAAAAGGACTNGGTTFTFGYDTTGDGAIDQTIDTTTICDGEQGPAGDPADELTVEQAPATSTECASGGTTLTFGYDTTGDGNIDTTVETVSICNSILNGQSVLYAAFLSSDPDTTLPALQTLDSQGLITLTVATSAATQISSGNFDAVIYSRGSGAVTSAEETALVNRANSGLPTIFGYWQASSPIYTALEYTTSGATNLTSADFDGLVLGQDISTVSVANASYGTFSRGLTPTGSATSGCTWGNGDSCAVVGNGGATVGLGFIANTISEADAEIVMRNALTRVLQ